MLTWGWDVFGQLGDDAIVADKAISVSVPLFSSPALPDAEEALGIKSQPCC